VLPHPAIATTVAAIIAIVTVGRDQEGRPADNGQSAAPGVLLRFITL
jgi:hypothetical protein